MKTTSLLNLIAGLASITAIGSVQLVLAPSSPLPRLVVPRIATQPVSATIDPATPRSDPIDGAAVTAWELQLLSD